MELLGQIPLGFLSCDRMCANAALFGSLRLFSFGQFDGKYCDSIESRTHQKSAGIERGLGYKNRASDW